MALNKPLRIITLDSIRGIAILMVLFNHMYIPRGNEGNFLHQAICRFLDTMKNGGWTGVDLFFVMSGFLISGLLFKEYERNGSIDIKKFLIRRSFKIYPSFIFFILIASCVDFFLMKDTNAPQPLTNYIKDLFFLHNYFGGRWGQTWSIDVEEFFYIIFPFILLWLIKRHKKIELTQLFGVFLILVLVAVTSRFIVNYNSDYSFKIQFTHTHLRLDSLFFGVLLCFIYNYRRDIIKRLKKYQFFLVISCLLIILINFFTWKGGMRSVAILTINPVAYGLLMIFALENNLLNFKPLAYIGKHSYNIYLWHYPLFFYSDNIIRYLKLDISTLNGLLIYCFIYFIIAIAPGIIITKVIEEPFLRIRDKIYPSHKSSLKDTDKVPDKECYKEFSFSMTSK